MSPLNPQMMLSIPQDRIPDGEQAGIAQIDFSARLINGQVYFRAAMHPDEEVEDASEGDFPDFDCTIEIESFKALASRLYEMAQEL